MSTTQHPEAEWLRNTFIEYGARVLDEHQKKNPQWIKLTPHVNKAVAEVEAKLKSAEIEARIADNKNWLNVSRIQPITEEHILAVIADLEAQLEGRNANKG